MKDKITIVLAAPSPLYAPLYLAKQQRIRRIFDLVDFVYADSLGSTSHDVSDPLFHKLLTKVGSHKCLISVGDPMRLIDLKPQDGWDEPLVIGGMLRRMCYWVINGESSFSPKNGDVFPTHFSRLIVHPRRMTGYALAYYEMKMIQNIQDEDSIRKFLFDDTDPGYEKLWYESLKSKYSRTLGKPLAYLTTNPIEALHANAERHLKRVFLHDDRFDNVIMTGFITGKHIYRENKSDIDEVMDGVKEAIDDIRNMPNRAASELVKYDDGDMTFQGKYGPNDIAEYLKELTKFNAFNSDPRSPVDEQCVKNSLAIRAVSEYAAHGQGANSASPERGPSFAEVRALLEAEFLSVFHKGDGITHAEGTRKIDLSDPAELSTMKEDRDKAVRVLRNFVRLAGVMLVISSLFLLGRFLGATCWADYGSQLRSARNLGGLKFWLVFGSALSAALMAVFCDLLPMYRRTRRVNLAASLTAGFVAIGSVVPLVREFASYDAMVGVICSTIIAMAIFYLDYHRGLFSHYMEKRNAKKSLRQREQRAKQTELQPAKLQ